jgi:hypothetical protein
MWKWLLSLLLLLSVPGCGNLPQTKFAPATETSIVLNDDRFAGHAPSIAARDVFCGRQESVAWAAPDGVAHLLLMTANPGCGITDPLGPEDRLIKIWPWLSTGNLRFGGEPVMIESGMGSIWVRQFERDDRHCFFFQHSFGDLTNDPHFESMKFIVGFFCGRPGLANTRSGIEAFVKSIVILDNPAVPSPTTAS